MKTSYLLQITINGESALFNFKNKQDRDEALSEMKKAGLKNGEYLKGEGKIA
jgi:hypothetical protein